MFANFRPHVRLTMGALALAAGAITLTGAVQASADDLGPFTCSNKSGGIANAPGTVAAIRVAHHDGYDRLVFDFGPSAAGAVPQYELTRQSSATFIRDASGQPVQLEGSVGIRTVLRNSDIASGVASDLKPRLPEIREVANIGNFERVVSYGVGLKDAACFRVLELSGPTRLVIDVQTPADASAATTPAATSQPVTPTVSATVQPSLPSDLAATGHPAVADQPAGMPFVPILLGLLAVTAGLTIAGLRRFARK
jgi:hypothetical protein